MPSGIYVRTKPVSMKTRQKLSNSFKGRPSPFRGHHFTEEMKKKSSETHKKVPLWNRGLTKETSPKILEITQRMARTKAGYWTGSRNPRWNGGNCGFHPGIFDFELKLRIQKKYQYKCQLCGISKDILPFGGLVIHHIDLNKNNCVEANLIPLCRSCHLRSHAVCTREPIRYRLQRISDEMIYAEYLGKITDNGEKTAIGGQMGGIRVLELIKLPHNPIHNPTESILRGVGVVM